MAPILGALFAILIGFLAIRPYINYQQQSFENIKSANTASQFRQVIDAAEAYVQAMCLSIGNNAAASASCQNIPLSQIISLGYLPLGTSGAGNPYGQKWYLNVINMHGSIVAVIYSSGGVAIPTQIAAQIAAETGQEGGFVPPTNLNSIYGLPTNGQLGVVGAYGHWSLYPLSNYVPANSGVASGNLVALLNITTPSSGPSNGGGGGNDYLYRTAVQGDNGSLNTMQTNLGMGGNAIQNAGGINVTSSLPQLTTPFLAQMVGTTTNGNPGGMVETTDKGGDTAIMQTDSTGSTIALTNKSKLSSTLSLTDNSNTNDSLQLTSTAQTVGQSCSSTQIGTIAPDASGSGVPVTCVKKMFGLQISASSNANIYNISYNFGSLPYQTVWQSISTGVTQSTYNTPLAIGSFYVNATPKPLFVTISCSAYQALLQPTPFVLLTLQGPNSSSSNQFSSATSPLVSVGLGVPMVAPALSVVVPPNFVFNYIVTNSSTIPAPSCTTMVTY